MHDQDQEQNFNFIKEIPIMPDTLSKVFEAIKNQNTSLKEISEAFKEDSLLCENVLKIVNSRYFTFGQNIDSIQKAIVLAGAMKIKNVAMLLLLKDLMAISGVGYLWEHSLKCAIASEFLATEHKTISADDAFAIGFLHDIGKIILYGDSFQKYLDIESNKIHCTDEIVEYENNEFQTNHCLLGAMILRKWHMPNILIDCVKYHHSPTLSSLPMVCGIIYAADRLVQGGQAEPLDKMMMERLDVSISDPKSLKMRIEAKCDIILNIV